LLATINDTYDRIYLSMDVAGYAMGTRCYMFEVHHGGIFNRQCRVNYIGGNVSNYPDPYLGNNLTFSDIEDVCSTYGYRSGDLIYYSLPGVSLDQGLRLISDDFSVNEMVSRHLDHDLLVLYIVSYGVTDDVVDEDEEEDSEYERTVVYRKDPFWDSVLSDDTDCMDSDEDATTMPVDEGVGNAGRVVDDEDEGVEWDVGADGHSGEGHAGHSNRGHAGEGVGDGGNGAAVEGGDHSDGSAEEYDSDQLQSPHGSDDDRELFSTRKDVTKRVPFDPTDMSNPTLVVGNTFRNADEFRKAVRQYNILRGKDLKFKKNERKRIVVVCKDERCRYRVYGRQLKDEMTFLLVSLRPKHSCNRTYQNHLITSSWIADWCIESFREQPNMPIDVLHKKVKAKYNVDVHVSSLYRARKKARETIYGKEDEQYHRLWDYCSMVRRTNVGSCLILMVERPMPQVPCKFQRLYISLAAMKSGFLQGCRPVVGLDACFLKGMYKGQFMSAVGRDAKTTCTLLQWLL
jgi:hypothetical protein